MGAWRPAASEVQLESATLAVRDRLLLRTRWGGRLSVASNAYAFTDANHPAPLSTRDLGKWFEHYQKAKRSVRERMLDHPRLFLQALKERAEETSSERLRLGPEGECEADRWRINELICRVRKRLGMLTPLSKELVKALASARTNFEGLQDDIKRYREQSATA
jgi:hypothetical protein